MGAEAGGSAKLRVIEPAGRFANVDPAVFEPKLTGQAQTLLTVGRASSLPDDEGVASAALPFLMLLNAGYHKYLFHQ